ncbi:MAG: Fic family protein [Nocardiopsaceae bacterium]|nr:Fic family protein [Nocardiopsaceae bacterium]
MTDSGDFTDPYIDPATGVLRNLVGAQTKADLDRAEGDLAFIRLVQLTDHPVKASGDLGELQEIHRHLFQDVYDWAGQLRTVDIRKNVEGAEFFLPVAMIDRAAAFAAGELASENMLRGLDRESFVNRLSYHYDQFNYIHPFREGNGRVQRVFWNRIARDAGWQLDWRPVRGSVNDRACRVAAEQRDFAPLHEMFGQIVTRAIPARQRDKDWHEAERIRMSFSKSRREP